MKRIEPYLRPEVEDGERLLASRGAVTRGRSLTSLANGMDGGISAGWAEEMHPAARFYHGDPGSWWGRSLPWRRTALLRFGGCVAEG